MNERSQQICRLQTSQQSRASYIKAKVGVLVPAQIRGLRVSSINPSMPFQKDLAREAEVHQSRISMFETPGMANMTLETLSKVAAALRVGLIVKFVPFSEMLRWDNEFHPDYNVTRLDEDMEFILGDAYTPEQSSSDMASVGQEIEGLGGGKKSVKSIQDELNTFEKKLVGAM